MGRERVKNDTQGEGDREREGENNWEIDRGRERKGGKEIVGK